MPLPYDPSREALYHPERRETLFADGRTYSPLQLAVEAARLAYFRAEESPAERARLVAALARVGFGELVLFGDSQTGAAAFAAHRSSDGTAILAFRGTRPDDYRDVMADLRADLVPWSESAGRVHHGFAVDLRSLKPRILEWLDSAKPEADKLVLTGHSLGAALATLAASIWRPGWLVTLGSPRVGDAAFAATVAATRAVRLVDCCDAVTEVPPAIGGYVHIAPGTYLTRDARTVVDPPQSFVMSDRRRARWQYALLYAWRSWRNVPARELADHAPINYLRAVLPAD